MLQSRQSFPTMSINPLANRPRADACGFGNGLRRLSARDLPYNALSTARRQPGILMHVHPVLPWNLKLQQPQLPRSEPDGQPTESSQLAHSFAVTALAAMVEVCLALAHKTKGLDTRAALLGFAYEFRTEAKRLERDERKLMVRAASDGAQKHGV